MKIFKEYEKNVVGAGSIHRGDFLPERKPGPDTRFSKEIDIGQLAQLEHLAIAKLSTVVAPFGLDFAEAVNIWVALKSKPALIFCGSNHVDLLNLASSIPRAIVGQASDQLHTFLGHPWWASNSRKPAFYIAAQQRFTSIRFRSFLNEVASHGNVEKLYFALLKGISRSELREFFVDIQRQVDILGGVLELPLDIASAPTIFPRNFVLLATISLDGFLIEEGDVLNNCSVIYPEYKPAKFIALPETPDVSYQTMQTILKLRCNFSLSGARKVVKQLDHKYRAIEHLFRFLSLLNEYNVGPRSGLVRDAMLYLANAWDANGRGLFDDQPEVNIRRITDFWLLQSAVPRLMKVINTESQVRSDVIRYLSQSFPMASRRIAQGLERG